jgi:hypothetical protein
MNRIATLGLVTMLMTGGAFFTTGCVEKKGPAQSAGERLDRTVENMKDAVDPPGPAEKAGRKVDRAVDDLTAR